MGKIGTSTKRLRKGKSSNRDKTKRHGESSSLTKLERLSAATRKLRKQLTEYLKGGLQRYF